MDQHKLTIIALIRSLFEEALEIGIAQMSMLKLHPVRWATSHLQILIDGEKRSVELWIKRVCDIQDNSKVPQDEGDFDEALFWRTWRAPRLIRMDPAGNAPYDAGTVWEREDESTSLRLLEAHCKMFVLSCRADLDNVAGSAQVQLAKRPIKEVTPSTDKLPSASASQVTSATHKPAAALDYRSELKRAVLLILVINPSATDRDICRRLDSCSHCSYG